MDTVANKMEKEIDINNIVQTLNFEDGQLQDIGNGLFLTKQEIRVLDQYHIPYKNCQTLKQIIWEMEEVLNNMDIVDEELDYISSTIAERDYYQNTNK